MLNLDGAYGNCTIKTQQVCCIYSPQICQSLHWRLGDHTERMWLGIMLSAKARLYKETYGSLTAHAQTGRLSAHVCVCVCVCVREKSWQRHLQDNVSFPGISLRPTLSCGGITGSSPAARAPDSWTELPAGVGGVFKCACVLLLL